MGEPALKIATYADVLNAPDGMNAEILDGELHLSPRPAPNHGSAALAMGADLREHFGRRRGGSGPGGWWILPEPELHLGIPDPTSIVVVPDLAGWRRERMPSIPEEPAITLPPDWICEILSPGARNTRRDRILKPDLYASRGVTHLWIADPIERLLEVWELRDTVYARIQAFSGDCIVRAKPFDAVELDLSEWWLPDP